MEIKDKERRKKICKYCGNEYFIEVGPTKKNLKKLLKFDKEDWKYLLFFILLALLVLSYMNDIKACREIVENPSQICAIYWNNNLTKSNNDLNRQINNSINLSIEIGQIK